MAFLLEQLLLGWTGNSMSFWAVATARDCGKGFHLGYRGERRGFRCKTVRIVDGHRPGAGPRRGWQWACDRGHTPRFCSRRMAGRAAVFFGNPDRMAGAARSAASISLVE